MYSNVARCFNVDYVRIVYNYVSFYGWSSNFPIISNVYFEFVTAVMRATARLRWFQSMFNRKTKNRLEIGVFVGNGNINLSSLCSHSTTIDKYECRDSTNKEKCSIQFNVNRTIMTNIFIISWLFRRVRLLLSKTMRKFCLSYFKIKEKQDHWKWYTWSSSLVSC
jgi:hypothetical protein